jgi:ubiquinone/menaquinone biosynthesis C-methylase UbiE
MSTTTTTVDPYAAFKAVQKQGWAHFAPLEAYTTPTAARLVGFAGVRSGQNVLDVAGGTGVVAITAARQGARATGSDFTPELLAHARENARIAEVPVEFHEADVEFLPFKDKEFDVVLSQFGHMFAPRPVVAVGEMLRVLKPGGTIAFATWPSHLFMGRMFGLIARYMPPPPPGVSPPPEWGDPAIIRERLGSAVKDLSFATGEMATPALSPQHHRLTTERTAGAVKKLVETLEPTEPAKLAEFRRAYDTMILDYLKDNVVHQAYLMTRATKV